MRARRVVVVALALLAIPLLLAGGVAGGLAAWALASRAEDPMDALRREGGVRLVRDSAYEGETTAGERRVFRDLRFDTDDAGTIRVTTSRPAFTAGGDSLPIVVILAGLRTGRESLAVVERHGPNLLVGYQYPYDQETWYQRSKLTQLPVIRRAVLDVPWQVSRVLDHLVGVPGTDPDRTALLGYSFGALFVPATQRLAAERGRAFDALILAFGGADIEALLEANLRVDPAPLRRALAWTAAGLLHAMEPEHHLAHITGPSLVIRGAADRQIPAEQSARLAELVPEPRRVVTLEGGHMHPRDPALTREVVRLSQEWLAGQGIIAD